jgi:hypothetical protein
MSTSESPPEALLQALKKIRRRRLDDVRRFIPHWRNYESWLKFELFAEMSAQRDHIDDEWTTGMEIPYEDGRGLATRARCDLFLGPLAFTAKKTWKAAGPGTWIEIKSLLKGERWAVDKDLKKLKRLRGAHTGGVLVSTWNWTHLNEDLVGPRDILRWYPSAKELTQRIAIRTGEGTGEARYFWIAANRE